MTGQYRAAILKHISYKCRALGAAVIYSTFEYTHKVMMLRKISFRSAIRVMLLLQLLSFILHLLVLSGIVPYQIIWGGNLNSKAEMLKFEAVSILVIATITLSMLIKAHYILPHFPVKVVNAFIWLFVILFSLNTVGNLLAKSYLETILFTPVTLVSAILCCRIAIEKQN